MVNGDFAAGTLEGLTNLSHTGVSGELTHVVSIAVDVELDAAVSVPLFE